MYIAKPLRLRMEKQLAEYAEKSSVYRQRKSVRRLKHLEFVQAAEAIKYMGLKLFARNVRQKSMQATGNAKMRRKIGSISMIGRST